MKRIEVKIQEKDKGVRDLSLFNLRDEVVNFLYKDTIASSTKADLQFFAMLYFVAIKVGNKILLEEIFDEGIPKFNKLNEAFAKKKGYLRAREYRKMVEEHGLSELFENDIFFVLVESILNIEEIEERYRSFLRKNPDIKSVLKRIRTAYASQLTAGLTKFKSSRIEDDRYDEKGNHHDLSKSVYRTVRMRNSRNLDLNLQKYTSVREIKSKSPVDLTFIQQVDPQIIFDLWDKYQVAVYMVKSIWRFANDTPIIANAVGGTLGGLVVAYAEWKHIDGKRNRKEKANAKQKFERAKRKNGKVLEDLTLRLVDSVLKANKRLEKEIKEARARIWELSERGAVRDKELIKKLEKRVQKLENLIVNAKLIDKEKSKNA